MSVDHNVTLLANIRLNDPERLEFFKVTLREAAEVFPEAHVKFRGRFAAEAAAFANAAGFARLHLYPDLREDDWIAATRVMLGAVRTRSVFLFFEDHRRVASPTLLEEMLGEFDRRQLDCLGYSFFRASGLREENLLPLETTDGDLLTVVQLDAEGLSLLGRIAPKYYPFTLLSIASVRFFGAMLEREDCPHKLYSRRLSALAAILFPYPGYRTALLRLNAILRRIRLRLCFYPPASPFNLEKMWFETPLVGGCMRLGVPKHELFANSDDDNGAAGESLTKRGLYPFSSTQAAIPRDGRRVVVRALQLSQGERINLRYHSAIPRITRAPVVHIEVDSGRTSLRVSDQALTLNAGDSHTLFGNKGGDLVATEPARITLRIWDEVF